MSIRDTSMPSDDYMNLEQGIHEGIHEANTRHRTERQKISTNAVSMYAELIGFHGTGDWDSLM